MYVYKRKVWNAHHHIQLDIRNFLLTSILLSSDPALLRRPRLPAQDMQQQRLETATRPAPGAAAPQPHSFRASRDSNSLHLPAFLGDQWKFGELLVLGIGSHERGVIILLVICTTFEVEVFGQLGLVLRLWCWAAMILKGLVYWKLIGHGGFFFFKYWDIIVGWH